ncbi:DB module [Dictyocaulus viviparus]|uniref:DB module n=1 Tax=Dictyocaulus viviparus TaxID=29172 RepID=A0A0D8XDF7_DICVI|nr:DB module [Dictyocaulus viviparus]
MIIESLMCFSVIEISLQCLTSGVCGSSAPGGYCSPPAALPCQSNSCQPGYSCGQYGCARNRARSALTKKVEGVFINDEDDVKSGKEKAAGNFSDRGIHTISRILTKTRSRGPTTQHTDNATLQKLTNPNFIFRKCCELRGLPDACLNKCDFNRYTRNALQAMYFKMDSCPIEATADMHFCAAQGLDHTECCQRNGVTTTLAGYKCLTFCDQRPNRITKLDYSYIPCYERFEQMKQCFYNEIRNKTYEWFRFE